MKPTIKEFAESMHLGTAALLRFFQQHRDHESLVLVTIIGTEGSTYRKPGAMMLISGNHEYVGMISGGCLEGDLLHHADEVFSSGEARKVTYDMHAGDDLVWSLGIGCDGIIHLLLQKLDRPDDFAMFDWLVDSLQQRQAVIMALCTAESTDTPLGSFAFFNQASRSCGNHLLTRQASAATAGAWPDWRYLQTGTDSLLIQVLPQPCVLICGAGPDSVPVAAQFAGLGWDCLVVDHRAGYANPGRFAAGIRTLLSRPEQLHVAAQLEQLDAAIIMAHHLENDAAYLRQLAPLLGNAKQPGTLQYLGVLGPAARRDKLRKMAGCPDAQVHGPAGLDIGAELPEAIALSIAAEVHAALNRRNGLSLTLKTQA